MPCPGAVAGYNFALAFQVFQYLRKAKLHQLLYAVPSVPVPLAPEWTSLMPGSS